MTRSMSPLRLACVLLGVLLGVAVGSTRAAEAQEATPATAPCYVGPCEPAAPGAAGGAAAAAGSSSSTDATPAADIKPRPQSPSYTATRIYGGIGYRRLYGVAFVSGEVAAGVGVRKDKLTILLRGSFTSGKSIDGLVLRDIGVGAEVDYRALGLLHVGGGAGLALGMLRRATNDHTLYDVGIGIYGYAAIDVLPIEEHALFLQATLAGELFMGHNSAPLLWGPSASAGIRY